MSYVAAQRIELHYDDDQRGRADSEKRARIRWARLPELDGDGVFHNCRASAAQDYKLGGAVLALPWRENEILVDTALRLRIENDSLVAVRWTEATEWSAKILVVPRNAWGRIIFTAKEPRGDYKSLVEIVINAGLFSGPPAASIFRGPPAIERDLRHDYLRNAYR